jgi:hypothetical protein
MSERPTLQCSACGAPVRSHEQECRYCGSAFAPQGNAHTLYALAVTAPPDTAAMEFFAHFASLYPGSVLKAYLSKTPALIQINPDKAPLEELRRAIEREASAKQRSLNLEVLPWDRHIAYEDAITRSLLASRLDPARIAKNLRRPGLRSLVRAGLLISLLLLPLPVIIQDCSYRASLQEAQLQREQIQRQLYPSQAAWVDALLPMLAEHAPSWDIRLYWDSSSAHPVFRGFNTGSLTSIGLNFRIQSRGMSASSVDYALESIGFSMSTDFTAERFEAMLETLPDAANMTSREENETILAEHQSYSISYSPDRDPDLVIEHILSRNRTQDTPQPPIEGYTVELRFKDGDGQETLLPSPPKADGEQERILQECISALHELLK